MKTSLFRIVTVSALLAASASGLFAGPSQDFHKRKHAARIAAQSAEASGKSADSACCCSKSACATKAKPAASSCCAGSAEKADAASCKKP